MTNDRRLWASLTLGSHLYGTTTEESDLDILNLYIPTPDELVANRHVKLPQCIKDGVDTRHLLLGDFVLSLGVNAEHMCLAYHYEDMFGAIETAWLNGRALRNILTASMNMWENAQTPKNRAHAYRYLVAAIRMAYSLRPLYPMIQSHHANFMALRNDDSNAFVTDVVFRMDHQNAQWYVDQHWRSNDYPDRQRLAEWTLLRYLGLS